MGWVNCTHWCDLPDFWRRHLLGEVPQFLLRGLSHEVSELLCMSLDWKETCVRCPNWEALLELEDPQDHTSLAGSSGSERQSGDDAAALPWEATRCQPGTSGSCHTEKSKGSHATGLGFLRSCDEFLVCSLQLFSKAVGITSWI